MKLRDFHFQKNMAHNWMEVFQNPHPVQIQSFKTGTVVINSRGTLNPEHPQAKNVLDEELEVPILAHWVHHEDKGDFLIDTGLDASYTQDPRGRMEGTAVDEFRQNKGENISNFLQKII